MKKSTIVLLVIIAVIALIAVSLVGQYNSIVELNENIDKKYSNIDALLEARTDKIPNLVNAKDKEGNKEYYYCINKKFESKH